MNQDFSSSFPPILTPSSELGALLFAALPCIHEAYRPLASFAFHMAELSRLQRLPAIPPLSQLHNVDAFISDKENLLRSLSFYGNLFHMPLLSTLASLLQAMQFYKTYKDILPGLFSAMNGSGGSADGMAGLFSSLGGLSPDLLSSLFSGFSGQSFEKSSFGDTEANKTEQAVPADTDQTKEDSESAAAKDNDLPDTSASNNNSGSSDLFDTLHSLLTPEQKELYEQLMHTD